MHCDVANSMGRCTFSSCDAENIMEFCDLTTLGDAIRKVYNTFSNLNRSLSLEEAFVERVPSREKITTAGQNYLGHLNPPAPP